MVGKKKPMGVKWPKHATKIWHQRDDNTRHYWVYTQGTSTGDNAAVGSIGGRDQ